ncbi:MAG TPA: hypothetical protein VNN80_14740 [Polyangiaceae bacterium]|nr:hypothetical protein [Polyangiaceae bacterium]
MKSMVQFVAWSATSLLLGVPLAAGCAGTEEGSEEAALSPVPAATEETPAVTETPAAIGVVEEGLTSVDQVDCSICQIARDCCHAVTDRTSFCDSYDADRCATLDPGRQRTTKIDCLVLLRYVITAWGGNPPPQCYIPGE